MENNLEGKARHLTGKIKEAFGGLLGDRKLKRQGRQSQREGAAQQDVVDRENAARLTRKQEQRKH